MLEAVLNDFDPSLAAFRVDGFLVREMFGQNMSMNYPRKHGPSRFLMLSQVFGPPELRRKRFTYSHDAL